jgi:chemotaxis protein MotB
MDEHPHPEIIIIKRHSSHEEEHHGGAWKIAFADFMTAMMAFFLVLWIINATDKNTKTIIARYFNPVKLEESTRTPKSIHGDDASQAAVDVPEAAKKGASGAAGPDDSKKTNDDAKPATRSGDGPENRGADKGERQGNGASTDVVDPAKPKPTMTEGALFSDPYRSLDAIAGPTSPDIHAIEASERLRDDTEVGSASPDQFRDPFRPIARETVAGAPNPGARTSPPPPAVAEAKPQTPAPAQPEPAEAAPPRPTAATAARLQKELELQVGALGTGRPAPAIDVKATSEGLLISLTDSMNFAMFPIGSAEPQPQVVRAMDAVARILKERPGALVVRGHTDAHPYRSATYDNWRLSSARAQIAYYMLVRAGVPESRFQRIEGYADRRLRDAAHPFAAENRRIEILLQEPQP